MHDSRPPSPPHSDAASVDGAIRRHLVRTDPDTGLGNRLLITEVLRSLAAPPEPSELVHGLVASLSDLHLALPPGRSGERASTLREFGAFLREALPEGAIAGSIGEGVAVILLPNRTAASVQAAAARVRSLWLRRAWTIRSIARPVMTVRIQPVPTQAAESGWMDRICREVSGPRSSRGAA